MKDTLFSSHTVSVYPGSIPSSAEFSILSSQIYLERDFKKLKKDNKRKMSNVYRHNGLSLQILLFFKMPFILSSSGRLALAGRLALSWPFSPLLR